MRFDLRNPELSIDVELGFELAYPCPLNSDNFSDDHRDLSDSVADWYWQLK